MKKKHIATLIIVASMAAAVYGIKCWEGIDIFRKFSLGIYQNRHFQMRGIPKNVFADEIKKVKEINTITVSFGQEIGPVNQKIFGHNILGHEGSKSADYGYGLWDSKWDMRTIQNTIDLAKDIGMTTVRFPGGCGTHNYDWKKTIGKNRNEFLFGMNEFLEAARQIGAEPVITLSYFIGDENADADLVEYLNAPNDGTNPNAGTDWATKRAENGHLGPYHVKYFEVGNEVWHGNHQDIKKVEPKDYAQRYLRYYDAIKAVTPEALIGVVLLDAPWNKQVLEIIKNKVNFGIIHTYPTSAWGEKVSEIPAKDIYKISLARPIIQDEHSYQETLTLLKENARHSVPLAITEYNGGFVQDKPVPYRHALGTALINAELLRIFMKPENNILIANQWNFVNEYWGMIANGFNGEYKTLNNPYYKRPNYYVFEMYAHHFGEELITAEVASSGYDISQYSFFNAAIKNLSQGHIESENLLRGNWTVRSADSVNTIENEGVLKVEFLDCFVAKNAPRNDKCTYNYYHSVKTTVIEPDTFYHLSGYIKTENLVDDIGVSLEAQDARGWTATHSAAGTNKVKGDTDWHYVKALYKTLPDARSVNIIARRIGEKGPLKGKAYFKDVKLEKFVPSIPDKIPYLSVNASKNADGSKVYLMVINKNMDDPITATIELKDFMPAQQANAWVLNGPSVDSTNEKNHDNVKVTHHKFEIDSTAKFEFTFEPHSLTAIELTKKDSNEK